MRYCWSSSSFQAEQFSAAISDTDILDNIENSCDKEM